ncbi:extracellular solute-binding protein [Candidatus Kaiserbacteria bacterium]|nr:extracellular solute-binding protein [Candidatus Kaiserbacteria bacterium]
MRPFQIGLLLGFGILAFIALVMLSNYESSNKEERYKYGQSVTIWGTLEARQFRTQLDLLREKDEALDVVKYVQVDDSEFDSKLINAIANGNGPDIIFVGTDRLVVHHSKIQPIPYSQYPVRDFKDQFIDVSDIMMFSDGIYALPLTVDPIVMYWNRDIYANGNFVQPPETWESVVNNVVPALTRRDSTRTIQKSSLAFGGYKNINNAKEIILTLLLQSGSSMVREESGNYIVGLNTSLNNKSDRPLSTTVQFYSDFSNPNSPLYTWNSSLPLDLNSFSSGDLATYFGFASEQSEIEAKNPNLNYDSSIVPQGKSATIKRTYADVYGLAILSSSRNKAGSYAVSLQLSGTAFTQGLADGLGQVPVRRSLFGRSDLGPFQRVAYESALFARSWLDPKDAVSDDIFATMIEDVVSNRIRSNEAAADAVGRLTLSY